VERLPLHASACSYEGPMPSESHVAPRPCCSVVVKPRLLLFLWLTPVCLWLWQLGRTTGVMTTYFMIIDSVRRNHPEVFQTKFGQFVASAGAATFGFWVVWPLEVLKVRAKEHPGVGHRQHHLVYSARDARGDGWLDFSLSWPGDRVVSCMIGCGSACVLEG
jgi:hypothetical protein